MMISKIEECVENDWNNLDVVNFIVVLWQLNTFTDEHNDSWTMTTVMPKYVYILLFLKKLLISLSVY